MNKLREQDYNDWILGRRKDFPMLENFQEVPYPEGFTPIEVKYEPSVLKARYGWQTYDPKTGKIEKGLHFVEDWNKFSLKPSREEYYED